MERENINIRRDHDRLEQYTRRSNIRLFGLEEKAGEDVNKLVTNVVKEKLRLDLPDDAIECAHRVGKQGNNPRAIIVKFARIGYKNVVFFFFFFFFFLFICFSRGKKN